MTLLESTMRRSKVYPELFALLTRHKYGMRKREVFREEAGAKHALKTVLVSAGGTSSNHSGAIARVLKIDDLFKE